MANATLLSAVSTDTTGTGASRSGPTTVFARGTFDGARVVIQIADEDVSASYVKADNVSNRNPATFYEKGSCQIDGQGTYYIRANLEDAGSSTSVTVVATQ